ncbi:hypothetical protein MMC13_008327 [Lambiella insularis]|nr:hypothetical protein [Lambiella insularis]
MASTHGDDIELVELNQATSSTHEETGQQVLQQHLTSTPGEVQGQEFSLPQADGGRDAWLFLAGCFAIEALVWGFPFSFGIFQDYYTTHAPFSSSAGIANIGTTSTGIMYLSSPLMFAILQAWPRSRRRCAIAGLLLIALALVASSFAQRVIHLILTQGILYAIGGTLLYTPTILFLDEWFVRRKGLAFGIMWAGTGMAGVFVPFLMTWGLTRYGFRTMLRAWALTLLLLSSPLLLFVKPRLPVPATARRPAFSFRFLRSSTFCCLQAGNVLQGLGFFIPNIYLPTYARALGLDAVHATVTVALANSAAVVGAVLLGALIDRLHVTTVALIATLGGGASVLLLWGAATSFPTLCAFSVLYGLTAGGFSCTYTGVVREVQKREPAAGSGMVFGMLSLGRGIGSVAAGPVSEALLGARPWVGRAWAGYGTGYGALIVFAGVLNGLGGVGWVARRVGWV